MTITGTSHFESLAAAVRYYRPYLGEPVFFGGDLRGRKISSKAKDKEAREWVQHKLESGEIHIGKPELKPGEKLLLNHEEGRYSIQSNG